jgi:peroxiredoxin Q/BCP
MKLNTGDLLPSFSLPDQEGNIFKSESFSGKKAMVIYFYPKDETSGCTREACAFRDSYKDFLDAGAEVIGISSDSVESHVKFARHHSLPFTLLSDENGELRKKFEVPSNIFGLLQGRVTYVVDKKGIIRYIFNSQVSIDKHITETLRIIRDLKN